MINDFFLADRVGGADMDQLWAHGWRHFGVYFFRYSMASHNGELYHVLPLRVALADFKLSRSQARVLRRNRDLQIVVRESFIDEEKKGLFERHSKRFRENVPDSVLDFMSHQPASVPCNNREICVYRDQTLLAFTFLDIGQTATSAVYAAFEPAEHKRSLGILMMLRAIDYSRTLDCAHYYPGYAYRESSMYDYKKRFSGLESLDWSAGWKRISV